MSISMNDVERKLCSILNQVGKNSYSRKILVECEDFTSLGYDSIDLMSIVVQCEEEFSFEFDDDNLIFSVINSFSSLSDIILKKMKEN